MRKIVLVALAAALPTALCAQELMEPGNAPTQVAPDLISQAQAAAARGDAPEALSRYLRVLAREPDNVTALIGAGSAALEVGDMSAAAGFFARAEDKAPRDGRVKAGLGATMAQNGNGRAALRFFREAIAFGVPATAIAADRALAYDLTGQPRRAQADYLLAIRTKPSDELTLRLALSQALAGDKVAALATLDPLLRRQSVAAWRTRAFVHALTGDAAAAERDAFQVMRRDQAEAIRPYLARLGGLRTAEKAAAVHLGRFPAAAVQAQVTSPSMAPQSQPSRTAVASAPAPATAGSAPRLPFDRAVTTNIDPAVLAVPSTAAAALPVVPPTPLRPQPSKVDIAAQARAEAREKAAAKAKADAAAAAKKKADEERAARLAAQREPARQWVQVAGGANKADLPKAWAQLKAKWPKQLAGQTAWTMPYRFTNRLLIGPFPSEKAAQDFVTQRNKEGLATFRVETAAGTAVERLK